MRVFNTHSTPPRYAKSFARQLDHLLARYDAIDPYRLEEILERGPPAQRPSALFTFDDGFRNHFEVAAAELERRGARGIFCLPAAFLSVPREKQIEWCRTRIRRAPNAEHSDEDLYAMSWDQARELIARGHRICCHSLTHEVLSAQTSTRTLESEIVESRHRLEDELAVPIDGFCWPSDRDRNAAAAQQLVRETYDYALLGYTQPLRKGHSRLDVNRTRIEASWPLEAVDLQISGLVDSAFMLRRARALLGR
jgi:peptidoglycan/xylan/chitin deacetylase (PgdA/CDA1 family)